MVYYAVIDTNVFISALLSKRTDAATVRVLDAMFDGKIVPLYHEDILAEYDEVLQFKKKGVQIKVLETAIAGMNFHVEGEQDEQNLDELIPGTELELYRDAENEFDEWAVAVYYGDERQEAQECTNRTRGSGLGVYG